MATQSRPSSGRLALGREVVAVMPGVARAASSAAVMARLTAPCAAAAWLLRNSAFSVARISSGSRRAVPVSVTRRRV